MSVPDYEYQSLLNFKHKEIFLNLKIAITWVRKGLLSSTKAQNVPFNKCYRLLIVLDSWYVSLTNFKHKEIFYIGQKSKNWLKWLIFGSKRLYYFIKTI